MKCYKCKKLMERNDNLKFGNYKVKGWQCSICKEEYYDDLEKVEAILLLNKLQKKGIKAKLGRNRTNLILRIPKDIEIALGLKQGEKITLKLENRELKLIPAH